MGAYFCDPTTDTAKVKRDSNKWLKDKLTNHVNRH